MSLAKESCDEGDRTNLLGDEEQPEELETTSFLRQQQVRHVEVEDQNFGKKRWLFAALLLLLTSVLLFVVATTQTTEELTNSAMAPMMQKVIAPLETWWNSGGKRRAVAVYFAGMIGTGHETLSRALQKACAELEGKRCKFLCGYGRPALWYASDKHIFDLNKKLALSELEALPEDDLDTIYFLNLFDDSECKYRILAGNKTYLGADLTFPGMNMLYKSDRFPDMVEMAQIAKQTNMDLRIVALAPSSAVANDRYSLETLAQRSMLSRGSEIVPNEEGKRKMWLPTRADPRMKVQTLTEQVFLMYFRSVLEGFYGQLKELHDHLGLKFQTADLFSGEFYDGGTNQSLSSWTGVDGLEQAIWDFKADFAKEWIAVNASATDDPPRLSNAARDHLPPLSAMEQALWKVMGINEEKPAPVQKQAFEEGGRPRAVFFAGIEGVGHHLWREILNHFVDNSTYPHVQTNCSIVDSLFKKYDKAPSLFHSLSYGRFHDAVERTRVLLQGYGENAPPNTTLILNLMDQHCKLKAGMISFPNFGGPIRNVQRADMLLLAQLCEEAGIDLQVVLMSRPIGEAITSTVDHRGFASEAEQILTFRSNSLAMYSQLSAMDRRFVGACLSYESENLEFLYSAANTLRIPYEVLEERFMNLSHPTNHIYERSRKSERLRVNYYQTANYTLEVGLKSFCPKN